MGDEVGFVLAGALVVVLGLAGLWALWRLARSPTRQVFGRIVPRVEISEPVVALTFDDGPTLEYVGEMVGMLEALDVRATFLRRGVTCGEFCARQASPLPGTHSLRAGAPGPGTVNPSIP